MPDPGNVSTVSTSRQVSHWGAAGWRMESKYKRLASAARSCLSVSRMPASVDLVCDALVACNALESRLSVVAMVSIRLFSVEILRPQLDHIRRHRRLSFPAPPVVPAEPHLEAGD